MKVISQQKRGMTVVRSERAISKSPLNHATTAAACIAASLAPFFQTTTLGGRIKDAISRLLDASLDASMFAEYERQYLFIARGGERALHSRGGVRLDSIIDAIVKCQKLRLNHQRFDGSVVTTYISPLSLAIYEHQLYLIGFVDDHLENIRFSRISAVLALKETFEYPSLTEYDPVAVFRDSLGIFIKDEPEKGISVRKVTLRLSKKWLPYVKTHRWHHSQTHRQEGDGIILEFRLRTCRELDRMILGFGPDAEVIAPTDLRARIAARAKELAAIYGDK